MYMYYVATLIILVCEVGTYLTSEVSLIPILWRRDGCMMWVCLMAHVHTVAYQYPSLFFLFFFYNLYIMYLCNNIIFIYNTQKAAIATLPLTIHPQQSEELHTFTYKSTLELIHAPITSLEWLNLPLLPFLPFHNLSS